MSNFISSNFCQAIIFIYITERNEKDTVYFIAQFYMTDDLFIRY